MREVYVAGAFMTRFDRHFERGLGSLAREAADGAMHDADIAADAVEFVAFGNAAAGILTGQEMIRAQTALAGSGLEGAPMVNVENACASASSAFHLAFNAIRSGQHEVALAVGAEKMNVADRNLPNVALARAVDVEELVAEQGDSALTEGAGPLFMEIYAGFALDYMETSGATQHDLALAAAKNRFHGSLNPKAQFRQAVTAEEVLASRTIVDPLTLFMCSPISDGAAALVLGTRETAQKAGGPLVRVRASAMQTGRKQGPDDAVARAAARAYEASGIGPQDLDVIELHDAAIPAEFTVLEELGVAASGEAPRLLHDGATRLGGRVPVNPSGGLLSRGHPIGATGAGQLVELADQLRGRAGKRQVDGARTALAENAGGVLGGGSAVAVVTVLEREGTSI